MYGLLKSCACRSSRQERDLKRLAYCGTCKALGALFGQKARLLLNSDAAFLAELLLALLPVPESGNSALLSFNCLALPAASQIPVELRISASVNLLLAQFHVLDRIEDSGAPLARCAQRIFSPTFATATDSLIQLGFSVDEAFSWLKVQSQREASAANRTELDPVSGTFHEPELITQSHFEQRLLYYAEATALVTASFFKQAAVVCAIEKADKFYELGCLFGTLVYVLDALEDYERDRLTNSFNAIGVSYGLPDNLPEALEQELHKGILLTVDSICQCLADLALPEAALKQFQQRFRLSTKARLALASKTKKRFKNCRCHHAPAADSTASGSSCFQIARDFSKRMCATRPAGANSLINAFVVAYTFLFALLFPRAAQESRDLRECREMSFNLMVLSSLPARIIEIVLASLGQLWRPAYALQMSNGEPNGDFPGSRGNTSGTPPGSPEAAGESPASRAKRRAFGRSRTYGGTDPNDNCCCNCNFFYWNCDCCDCGNCTDCCGSSSCDCGNCGNCDCNNCDCCKCDCSNCDCCKCDCGNCDCCNCDCK